MTPSRQIRYLLSQLKSGLLSEKEQEELDALLQDPDHALRIQEELARSLQEDGDGEHQLASTGPLQDPTDWQAVLQRILSVDKAADPSVTPLEDLADSFTVPLADPLRAVSGIDPEETGRWEGRLLSLPRIRQWRRSAAAIVLLALAGWSTFFLLGKKPKPLAGIPLHPAGNIIPGTNQAVLTLSNGQQIVLNSAQNGVLTRQGNVRVIKLDSGRLAYNGNPTNPTGSTGKPGLTEEAVYNMISTPRGGQYQVTLPDGTKVWLNSESGLRFPVSFTGKEREVQLNGEAYFEVTADKNKPFLVKAGLSETRVFGTHFNIMAYGDEKEIRTTLLEGSVKIEEGGQSALLQPGEQGVFAGSSGAGSGGSRTLTTKTVNTRAVTAWKDGYYYFDRTPVQSVMRQIARWYDVEIVYQGLIPRDEIVGKIPRTAYVSEVLHIMEPIGIHFKIEDRKIIVISQTNRYSDRLTIDNIKTKSI